MVRIKESTPWAIDGNINVHQWLEELENKFYFGSIELIRKACSLSQSVGKDHYTEIGVSCEQLGLSMAVLLADLEVDEETIIAAIIFEAVHLKLLSIEIVEQQLGPAVVKLVNGIEKMRAIANLQVLKQYPDNKQQLELIRKMLLAMVDDARVALIKLAERLCILRSCSKLPPSQCQLLATEAMEVYAPLANCLGIGAIKWEMEDLAFRYLQPDSYKSIAKSLKTKRLDRDKYVNFIIEELNAQIKITAAQRFAVYGRAKHIHSIYRKMKRKNVSLDEIYDAIAVRILVASKEQCYQVLSLVHALWQQIPSEFDDYIAHPKSNGYQSLHTAVQGPEGRVFEVQIRTFKMHDFAERGVAAHWKYKEGAMAKKQSQERKIAWLRDVLTWHHEMAVSQGVVQAHNVEFLEDRVYIFTPDGDVLDLPREATPLDFAYHLHSNLGHRCRGAKVNGAIVPLTYTLTTGDRVEILTGKEIRPSRDWLNPHLHYLKTARAKAKVSHWFRMQDYDKNKAAGLVILAQELQTLGIKAEGLDKIVSLFNFKHQDDLLAALGRGDLKVSQIIAKLLPILPTKVAHKIIVKLPRKTITNVSGLSIEGVSNILNHRARCCQPVLGDEIIGYITLNKGIAVHRKDCANITHADSKQQQRFVQVNWGGVNENFLVDLIIKAYDRVNLVKDLTSLLALEKIKVYNLVSRPNRIDNIVYVNMQVEVHSLDKLSALLRKFELIPNVIEARRQWENYP